MLRDETQLDLV